MDVLYDHIENYNEVNIVQELKGENAELKKKLEKYNHSIGQLQKEFDNLSSEYKKLELNYSSLLKTARAEIQRKTKTIVDLNTEKDALVLNFMQNRNKTFKGRNTSRESFRNSYNNHGDNKSNNMQLKDNNKNNPISDDQREHMNRHPSADVISSGNTNRLSIDKNRSFNIKKEEDKGSEVKENISNVNKNEEESKIKKSQKLINRRKSMPVLGKQFDEFSSDEDNFDNDNKKVEENAKTFLQKDYELGRKVSETIHVNDKYSYQNESLRDKYQKKRVIKYNDGDKFKSRDKYEPFHRSRNVSPGRYHRHYSPERQRHSPGRQRHISPGRQRHFSPDRQHNLNRVYLDRHKPGYGRSRMLESPPSDRHSSDRRRGVRRDCDREPPEFQFRFRNENNPVKHKINYDHAEPNSKRLRSHYSNNEEEKQWHSGKEVTDFQMTYGGVNDFQQSCQSPDYSDNAFCVQPVKEIMNTAEVQLEDPRLTSKKYIVQNDNKNKNVIFTLSGRNIELMAIDKTPWNATKVPIPEALSKPLQCQDVILNDIYKDIEKPTIDFSPEPGLPSDTDDENHLSRDKVVHDNYRKVGHENSFYETKDNSGDKELTENDCTLKTSSLPGTEFVETESNLTTKSNLDEHNEKVQVSAKSIVNAKLSDKENPKDDSAQYDSVHCSQFKSLAYKKIYSRQVESDLELSDETNDNIEYQNQDVKINKNSPDLETKNYVVCGTSTKLQERLYSDNECKEKSSLGDNLYTNTKETDVLQSRKNIIENTDSKIETKSEHISNIDSTKKDKVKKKLHKKGKGKLHIECNDEVYCNNEIKNKKCIKPQEIKSKFTELFGDSSSLIMPEDLGLSPQIQPSNYITMSEDAQDAIDLKSKISDKMQTRLSKTKSELSTVPNCTNMDVVIESNTEVSEKVIDNIDVNITDKIQKEPADATEIVSSEVEANCTEMNKSLEMEPTKAHADNKFNGEQGLCSKALVTSTPAKWLLNENTTQVDSKMLKIPTEASFEVPSEADESVGTLQSQSDVDVPDVRIVLTRRKRKSIKTKLPNV